jgi:hypothetical protein
MLSFRRQAVNEFRYARLLPSVVKIKLSEVKLYPYLRSLHGSHIKVFDNRDLEIQIYQEINAPDN